MSTFFDALRKASDDAGVPMPTPATMKPAPMTPAPTEQIEDQAIEHTIDVEQTESPEPKEMGLEDAADVECITPDGWYATEAFDELYQEDDD